MDLSWLSEAILDALKLLPFLFLTYLLMEYIEYHALEKTSEALKKVGPFGPIIGAGFGIIPQCGFSTAASGFFAGGLISLGTLFAVFLSTSDEMLPLLISQGFSGVGIASILLYKFVIAAATGFAIDLLSKALKKKRTPHIHEFCESEHCHCEDGIFKSAVKHTIKIWLFILVISVALGYVLNLSGFENVVNYLNLNPVLAVFISCLIGLIPNCAASVALTQCYLQGVLSAGAMMAGLLVSSGMGLLMLFRTNHNLKENIVITGILYAVGILWGLLLSALGVSF